MQLLLLWPSIRLYVKGIHINATGLVDTIKYSGMGKHPGWACFTFLWTWSQHIWFTLLKLSRSELLKSWMGNHLHIPTFVSSVIKVTAPNNTETSHMFLQSQRISVIGTSWKTVDNLRYVYGVYYSSKLDYADNIPSSLMDIVQLLRKKDNRLKALNV